MPTPPANQDQAILLGLVTATSTKAAVAGTAVVVNVAGRPVPAAPHALVTALVTTLARARIAAALAATAHAGLGAVAELAVVALGVGRASAAISARESAFGAPRIATIDQVAVTAESAVGVAVRLLATIVRTVVASLAGLARVVVIARASSAVRTGDVQGEVTGLLTPTKHPNVIRHTR